MRSLTVAACISLTAALPAQFPFGRATEVNGYGASLFAQPIWIGNPGYGYGITGAPPGGTAFVAISSARQDQVISGLDVYLDLANVAITHQSPIDAFGRATIPVPLASPDIPALTGSQFYAQAAVTDPAAPGSLGTTQAVLIEVTLHPLLAISLNSHVWLVDPVTVTATALAGLPAGSLVADLFFANGGRDLFITTSIGIYVADTLAPAPQAVFFAPGLWRSVAWDRVHRRVYALEYVDNPAIAVFDGDRSSPGFGSLLLQLPNPSPSFRSVSVSTDGSVVVFGNFDSVVRCDGEPTSATYLQQTPLPPIPPGTGFSEVHVSPDGRVVSHVALSQFAVPPLAINRFDSVTGSWIDHDPATPGIQPISTAIFPALDHSFVFPTRDGSAWVFGALHAVGRIELDLHSPSNVAITSATSPQSQVYAGITPSGSFLLKAVSPFTTPWTALSFVQVATGWETPWVTIPEIGDPLLPPVIAWR